MCSTEEVSWKQNNNENNNSNKQDRMTNILSTLRGSGIFCVKLVRNTSKLISRFLNLYSNENENEESFQNEIEDSSLPPEDASFQWPSR